MRGTVLSFISQCLNGVQARGLSRGEAESLLLEAFANEALDMVADEAVRARYGVQATAWLAHRSGLMESGK